MEIEIWVGGSYKYENFLSKTGAAAFIKLPDYMRALTRKKILRLPRQGQKAEKSGPNKACLWAVQIALEYLLNKEKSEIEKPRECTLTIYSHNEVVLKWLIGEAKCDEWSDLMKKVDSLMDQFRAVDVLHIRSNAFQHPKYNRVLHYLQRVSTDIDDFDMDVDEQWCREVLEVHQKSLIGSSPTDLEPNFLRDEQETAEPETMSLEEKSFIAVCQKLIETISGASRQWFAELFKK